MEQTALQSELHVLHFWTWRTAFVIPLFAGTKLFSYLIWVSNFSYLMIFFVQADVSKVRFYTKIFEWIGRNALLVYVLAVSGVLQAVLVGFYIGTPENNLVKNCFCLEFR